VRLAARRRGWPATGGARSARTRAGVFKTVGRVLLWCVVAVLLVRGAADVFAVEDRVPAGREGRGPAVVWPDDQARAFALDFARAYLGYSPADPDASARQLLPFVGAEVRDAIVPRFAQSGPRQVVENAVVARVARVNDRRALVTVAAWLAAEGDVDTRYLTVPVARDARGGLVVDDLPSFAAPPARGQASPPESEPLSGVARSQIEDVLERFFEAFLAGRSEDLEYLMPAGARTGALDRAHELVGVDSVAELGPAGGRERLVLATVRARDPQTRAVYALRYRVRLVRADRWYVVAVNSASKGG
jgi:Conjugative transposon protein TcpC